MDGNIVRKLEMLYWWTCEMSLLLGLWNHGHLCYNMAESVLLGGMIDAGLWKREAGSENELKI